MSRLKGLLILAIVAIIIVTMVIIPGCKTATTAETTVAAETTAAVTTAAATTAAETTAAETTAAKKIVIGYASMGDVNPFHAIVTKGMKEEVAARGYDIIALDNNWTSETTVKNVDELVSKKVDIIICGVSDAAIVPVIKKQCEDAGIPIVLIDHLFPGVPMFGGNNIIAGGIGGTWLGQQAKENWDGDVDLYIGLEYPTAGEVNELRMKSGFIDAMRKVVDVPDDIIHRLAGNNDIALSTQLTQDTLTAHPDAKHILIGNLTDDCARGALAAIEKLGLEKNVYICGQGFYDEVSAQNFQTPEPTAWGATVAYWPGKYAFFLFEKVDPFLKDGTPLPMEWNVKHVLVTRENVADILAGKVE